MRRIFALPGYDTYMNSEESELNKYVDEWVAFSRERAEASAKTLSELVKKLKSVQIPIEHVFITKVRKNRAMIL